MSAVYRVRQFIRAAGAWVRPDDTGDVLAGHYLASGALNLFRSMPGYDRRHGLNVLRTLQERGYTDPDLLAAALLHDVGKTGWGEKGGVLRLWHRVAVVLMRAFWPGLLERLGRPIPPGSPGYQSRGRWQQPFFVQQHHAGIGAELAHQAGCSPRTVALIGRHEDPPREAEAAWDQLSTDPLLVALQAADGVN